ncbi:MAG: sigma-54 dependent transcriptional regulator [Caulobacteraceae bacterium]
MFARVNSVAFVDDDERVRLSNSQSLELAGLTVHPFARAGDALQVIDENFRGVVVSDISMPQMDGRAFFARISAIDPDIPVIFITGHANVSDAVSSMMKGAHDYLEKPYGADRLVQSVRRALDARQLVLDDRQMAATPSSDTDMLIGNTPVMERLRADIRRVAETDVAIVLEGETGTGKEVVARLIHRSSARRIHPFTPIDFAAIPEGFIESELFGHEAGSFGSGARRRVGRIEAANRGTIFLDEIESLPLSLQGCLLRVLEEREVTPLGANEPRGVDARVIAATKENLQDLVHQGNLRKDLFYRLNIVRLQVPSLRERREDIPLLFNHFLVEAAARFQLPRPALTDSVRARLLGHHWPGNVRELQNYAGNVVLGMAGDETPAEAAQPSLQQRVDMYEAQLISDALSDHAGDVRQTIARLAIPRKTFYDKLKRHEIDISRFRPVR